MKILYLMHVDWNWIKQRPHFIAEEFGNKDITIHVLYKPTAKKFLVQNNTQLQFVKRIKQLRGQRFFIIRKLNQLIYNLTVQILTKINNYDYVYITHPTLFLKNLKSKIIYDCMDDNAAFSMTDNNRNKILHLEKKLIEQSNIVLFSSNYLSETVIKRIGFVPKKYRIINNAINLPYLNTLNIQRKVENKEKIILSYIGTISDWFDIDLLNEVQQRYTQKKIIFNLYGPVDSKADFKGFNLKGSIQHDEIFNVMDESDILIMPFILNELIKSVNPVKLYEYIYSGKPVISVEYGETEKFSDYVYLYKFNNPDSFIDCLNDIEKNNYNGKASLLDARNFVKNNTWKSRVDEIIELL